jgi:hypothetical protein
MDVSPNVPSFLRAAVKLSVWMNGLLVPFNRTLVNLQRFCRPVMFHNDDPIFDLSSSGSSLLFRHTGRNLMVCTRHQLVNQGRDPADVLLIIDEPDGSKVALTPDQASRAIVPLPELASLEDIVLAEYASERSGRNIKPQFLQLDLDSTADLRHVRPEEVLLIFAVGYPTRQAVACSANAVVA